MDGTDKGGKDPANLFPYMDISCVCTKEVCLYNLPFTCTNYPSLFARCPHLDHANIASKPQRVPDHGAPDMFQAVRRCREMDMTGIVLATNQQSRSRINSVQKKVDK